MRCDATAPTTTTTTTITTKTTKTRQRRRQRGVTAAVTAAAIWWLVMGGDSMEGQVLGGVFYFYWSQSPQNFQVRNSDIAERCYRLTFGSRGPSVQLLHQPLCYVTDEFCS
uniref:Uncharacterized protein n=1 Tax=Vespula pensylvanica TaxID=30213 RepID=A0A834NCP6_VESPE|nr:hypothetical protein H0235_015066 [Vespula pensylvanica]